MDALAVLREETPAALVLHVVGPLSLDQVVAWRRELARAWRGRAARVVLDLSSVTYMDTAGAALLISAFRRARGEARVLSLAGLHPQGQRVFQLMGLGPLLNQDRVVQLSGRPDSVTRSPRGTPGAGPLESSLAAEERAGDGRMPPPLPAAPRAPRLPSQI
ncbi:MAG: STAS domain-containing protein [Terriglobia bacterium]